MESSEPAFGGIEDAPVAPATMVAMPPYGADPVPVAIALPVAVALLTATWLVGSRLLPPALRTRHGPEAALLSLSVGITVVGVATWTAGAVLGTGAAIAAAAALAVAGVTGLPAWWRDLRRLGRRVRMLAGASPVLSLLLLGTTGMAVLQLALPVIDSDGLRYHLALPKLFLIEGRIFFYPWDVHAAFPQTVEAVYMLGLRAAGGEVAKFLHFGAFAASLAALMVLLHHDRGTRRAAVCGPCFLAASPAVLVAGAAAFIDLFVVFHVTVAMLLSRRRAPPVLVGLALAGAAASKWSAAPAVLGLVLLLWWRRRWRPAALAAVALPVLLAVLPYAVRNLAATGDPFFPMGVGLLRGEVPGVDEARQHYVTQVHRDIPGPLGIPWGPSVGEVQRDEVAGWHLLLGLMALPLLLLRRGGGRERELLAVAVPYLLIGLAYHPSVRLAMPLLLCLAASSAILVCRIAGRWSSVLAALLVAPALVTAWAAMTSHGRPLAFLAGRIGAAEVIRASVPGREAALLVNRQPPGGRVMALDFPPPFYFSRPWIAEGINNRPPLAVWLEEGHDARRILVEMQRLDVRFVVVTPGYGGGTPASLVTAGEDSRRRAVLHAVRARLELVGTRDGVDVYRVPPP